MADADAFLPVPARMLSRLLYPNPVCALITANAPALGGHNVMTVSWLTAADNDGGFLVSLNAARHSAANVLRERAFTLSPYSEAQRAAALAAGGCHGTALAGGKLAALALPVLACGGGALAEGAGGALPVLARSPAHMRCRVAELLREANGHLLLLCQVEAAWVRAGYWQRGKLFAPATAAQPRLLSFLGSRTFAVLAAEEEGGGGGGGGGSSRETEI